MLLFEIMLEMLKVLKHFTTDYGAFFAKANREARHA